MFVLLVALSAVIGERAPKIIERVRGTDPLNVVVGADVGFYSDGWAVILPNPLDDGATPPPGLDDHLQARNHLFKSGAFDLRMSHLLLALEGRSVDPVRITGLRSRVVRRSGPLSGAVVRSPSAGAQEIVAAYFDLERDEAVARTDEGHDYFQGYVFTLGRGESLTFRIIAQADRSACEWELVIAYSHRGVRHELVVDSAGELFRTAARSEAVAGSYDWAWYEQPARLVPTPVG